MTRFLVPTVAALALVAACSGGGEAPEETSSSAGSADTETSEVTETTSEDTPTVSVDVAPDPRDAILAEARSCSIAEDAPIPQGERLPDGERSAETNAQAALAYLETARATECVFELPSGLLFRIRRAVDEGASPVSGDMVTVHYRGMFMDGSEFDSSYSRGEPATFPSNRLIRGWVEALPLMRVGEHWELFINPDLGYGSRGTPGGPIGPYEALVFELELIDLP